MSQHEQNDKSQHFYRASAADFMKIPGSPVAYWVSKNVINAFDSARIEQYTISEGQNKTANNEKFVRNVWEVSFCKIGRNKKWLSYAKGGDFRKWYGNKEHLVDWSLEARSHYRKDSSCRIIAEYLWYRKGITWTLLTSSNQSFRLLDEDETFDMTGSSVFVKDEYSLEYILAFLNSTVATTLNRTLNPTLALQIKNVRDLPLVLINTDAVVDRARELIYLSKKDWDSYESSIEFCRLHLLSEDFFSNVLSDSYQKLEKMWSAVIEKVSALEEKNNIDFIHAYDLYNDSSENVSIDEISLTCNPYYRYGGNRSEVELYSLRKCDSIKELASYVVGCMMGRYSIDKPGLILASQGETLQDYLNQIPNPRFMPDHDAILPLTDQEWFADDVTNRVREFVKVVWGEDTLQENLAFIAESLCLHAIKPLSTKNSRGESSIETIRRYLSTQFFKDHLKTYKKRPIYWLFSSGKEKAFECLVYLHRYNESTLARMRTEYVTPLMGKYDAQQGLLQEQLNDASPAQQRELEKQLKDLAKKQTELRAFDENLKHYADMRIKLDLDDGVKVNYGKFGNLLAEVKAITGDKSD
jgi:hypothetical protein